ncbi:MAG: glycosyltransferase family 4 protein [bacterium]|nr:glycosyltransferase family 4 protein [bacterium]
MKVLYLFNRVRENAAEGIKLGKDHDNHFFGMYRLQKYGIEASYIELESVFAKRVASFLRKYILNIHTAHVPLLPFFRRYDVVFTSTAFGTFLAKNLLFMRKPKWVLFDYGLFGLIGNRKTFKQKLLYYLVSRADGIVTISKAEQDDLYTLFPAKKDSITFIPLGTDTTFFTPQQIPEEDFIISVGRDPGRDFGTLIDAIKDTSIHLKLTAKPQQLKRFAPLPFNISVHDFSPAELLEQYAKSKLVVLPLKPRHQNDSMGCSTLVESMAMGKAVIATDTSTMASYITNGKNGILVPELRADILRNEIVSLLSNKTRRDSLGKEARKYILETSDSDIFARHLANYFNSF